jgi:hypothetical protein
VVEARVAAGGLLPRARCSRPQTVPAAQAAAGPEPPSGGERQQ